MLTGLLVQHILVLGGLGAVCVAALGALIATEDRRGSRRVQQQCGSFRPLVRGTSSGGPGSYVKPPTARSQERKPHPQGTLEGFKV